MDLRAVLLRATAARPRVLLVTMPGATRVRLAAERELRRRDLPEALTPADTDILLVAGPARPGVEDAVDRLWRDVPAPRSRAHARTEDEVAAVVAASRLALSAPAVRRADGRETAGPAGESHQTEAGKGDDSAPADDQGHGNREGHRHREGHDHPEGHGGGMDMPAGLPMAEPGPDRDGLTLDRIHVPFGPFLPDWPAGLTIRLTLQGDVIQQADCVELAPERGATTVPFWTEPWLRAAAGEHVLAGEAARRRAAAHLDSLGRFLAVAGWPAAATAARRLRDDLLAGAQSSGIRPRTERLARRVGRSRTLYWLTRGLGNLSQPAADAAGVSGPAARANGDVPARYRQWLTAVLDDVARLKETDPLDPAGRQSPRGRLDGPRPPSAALVDVLPRLLEGVEVAAARLIVASLDPDPDELAARPAEVAHG
jgi:hypothetical protein